MLIARMELSPRYDLSASVAIIPAFLALA